MIPSGTATSAAKRKAAEHAPDRDADVAQEAVLGQEVVAFLDHREGIGQEGLGDVAAQGGEAPGRHEQNEEQDAERDAGRVRDRRERLHAAAMRWSRSSGRRIPAVIPCRTQRSNPGGIATNRTAVLPFRLIQALVQPRITESSVH